MNPLAIIDRFLNNITMYRLVTYGLVIVALLGIGFSFAGVLSLSGTGLLLSLGIAVGIGYASNKLLSRIWNVPSNTESWLITALILFCIMPPATTALRVAGIAVATLVAIASKYIVAYNRKHIFNPAALGAVVAGVAGLAHAFWWVGSVVMLPFIAVFALLIVRKIRRYALATSYVLVSVAVTCIVSWLNDTPTQQTLMQLFVSSPLVFLGGVMLTEPATMPPRRHQQIIYGSLVAVLFASQIHIGNLFLTPEIALVVGNLFAYAVSPKQKWLLRLKERRQLSPRVYDLVFTSDKPLYFKPGQYMEWTLEHPNVDDRGNRRSFSIASSPTETDVHLGIKVYQPSSSYKSALLMLKPGDSLVAGGVSGNFVLPTNPDKNLVFIAGGIGITPFRSMLQYLIDTNQKRNITLIYLVSDASEVSYEDVLASAHKHFGLKIVLVLTSAKVPSGWKGLTGHLTPDLVHREVPDHKNTAFYLSGPDVMVRTYRRILRTADVPPQHIVVDYFSGY